MQSKGILILEDGTAYQGELYGKLDSATVGELVFNTSMAGGQEILTDPGHAGQLVVMTYPLLGTYEDNPLKAESKGVCAQGIVVKELRKPKQFSSYQPAVPVLTGIDTRALTRHLHQFGSMPAAIGPAADCTVTELLDKIAETPSYDQINWVKEVTCSQPTFYAPTRSKGHIAIVDLGLKNSILEAFLAQGYAVSVFPANVDVKEILRLDVDGVILSNGPGNPRLQEGPITLVRNLVGKVPIFGICLGQLIIALALGGQTTKLKLGHHGMNQSVRALKTNKILITMQNHGYAVEEESLVGTGLYVTHRNLNDGTIEGLAHQYLPVAGVQYQPELSFGFQDAASLFSQFWHEKGQAKAG